MLLFDNDTNKTNFPNFSYQNLDVGGGGGTQPVPGQPAPVRSKYFSPKARAQRRAKLRGKKCTLYSLRNKERFCSDLHSGGQAPRVLHHLPRGLPGLGQLYRGRQRVQARAQGEDGGDGDGDGGRRGAGQAEGAGADEVKAGR